MLTLEKKKCEDDAQSGLRNADSRSGVSVSERMQGMSDEAKAKRIGQPKWKGNAAHRSTLQSRLQGDENQKALAAKQQIEQDLQSCLTGASARANLKRTQKAALFQ
jgi:hypothetical protein